MEQAKSIIATFITNTVYPEFLPSSVDIKRGYEIDGNRSNQPNKFTAIFSSDEVKIDVSLAYANDVDQPDGLEAFVQLSIASGRDASPALASDLTHRYFLNPYSPINKCQAAGAMPAWSVCEEFRREADGWHGYGVVLVTDGSVSPPQLMSIVFACVIFRDGRLFGVLNSCIATQ